MILDTFTNDGKKLRQHKGTIQIQLRSHETAAWPVYEANLVLFRECDAV